LKQPHYQTYALLNKNITVWDVAALVMVLTVIFALGWGASNMITPYNVGENLPITLSPAALPGYAVRSVTRILIAMLFSLFFTFVFGTWAAKSREAEKVILPFIDIMQSVPVLGVLSVIVVACIRLFPGSLMGPELAAIIAIFTAQAWNMSLSFYQSLKTVPKELQEAASMLQLSALQRFWRLEVPFALPGLMWNTMVSMSASWFFVVASEAISVSNQTINLPGIGSYIAAAIDAGNLLCCLYAILAMFFVILVYDQLLFRPLLSWSLRFRLEAQNEENTSWFLDLLQRARTFRKISALSRQNLLSVVHFSNRFSMPQIKFQKKWPKPLASHKVWIWRISFYVGLILSCAYFVSYILQSVPHTEIPHVAWLGLITLFKVFVLIFLCSLIWVPIGVKIGLSPRARGWAQPICQFLAAFPANLFYPVIVMLILHYDLSVNIFTTPLMILGTQWYVLFNVIAGASQIPQELLLACDNFGVRKWQRWKKLILPAIFPYYITGAMTASGGSWNASIIADVVEWGSVKLTAVGLGGYITEYTTTGDFPRIALGIGVMCAYVLVVNHILWLPLYRLATQRFALDQANE